MTTTERMPLTITEDNCCETGLHSYSAFASDIGLKPGDFPNVFQTKLGNGKPFIRTDGGDDKFVAYRQMFGCLSMKLFNT